MTSRDTSSRIIRDLITVGRVLAPWGTKGEVKVEIITSFPERLSPGRRIFVRGVPLVIEQSRLHGKFLVLKFQGIDSIDAAQNLRGEFLEILEEEAAPLPEGEYYQFQIIDLEVWTTDGSFLGRVAEIIETGSNDVYIVRSDGREVLIPATEDVVQSIDLERGRMIIEPIQGLL